MPTDATDGPTALFDYEVETEKAKQSCARQLAVIKKKFGQYTELIKS